MKKLISNALFLCLVLLAACRKQPPEDLPQRNFATGNFHSVIVKNIPATFVEAGSFLVQAQGLQEDIQALLVQVINDTLFVEPGRAATGPLGLIIRLPAIRQFSMAGAGSTKVQGFRQQDTITAFASNGHFLEMNTSARGIFLYAMNRARVRVSGEAATFRSLAADSSQVEAYPLRASDSRPIANNASEIYTTVINGLWASAMTNSRIYYRGNPGITMTSELDGGRIIRQ